jgi:alkylresorcinol/alkylpyrone synthase
MHQANPSILSVATATPPHRIPQPVAKDFARAMFSDVYRDIDRLLPIFDHSGVENRNFCVPAEWFYEDHSFSEKNDLYVESALDLSEKAARRALDKAGADPSDVAAVFFVSTTGLAIPSIDSFLLRRLGLSEHTRRVPVVGLGCAAGASGLGLAAHYARACRPGELVLLVAVELCGLTFQKGDRSKANLVSTALFADGAAAVLIGREVEAEPAEGPELLGSYTTTWPGTEDIMGFDVGEHGLKVLLSRSVPSVVYERMPENLRLALDSVGLSLEDIRHPIIHPGGAKVLDAFEEVLGLEPGGLDISREVLREHGNMSSVTVLFILERFLAGADNTTAGEHGVLSAMGPGFSAEHVFFRC